MFFVLCSISLRVVTEPSDYFDGTTVVSFGAIDFRLSSDMSATVTNYEDEHDDDDFVPDSAASNQGQAEEGALASSERDILEAAIVTTVSFNVTFFHCAAGSFWNLTLASKDNFNLTSGDCKICTEEMEGAPEVLEVHAGGRPWQLYSVFGLICCDHLAFSIGLVHAELNTGRLGSALSRRLWSITGWHIFPGIPL